MANIYSAIYSAHVDDDDYWDGTIDWGYDATSDKYNPTAHVSEAARDAQYIAVYTSAAAWETARDGVSAGGNNEYGIVQGPWSADDTAPISFGGWSSDAQILRTIGAARNQTGIWDDGALSPHRMVAANATRIIALANSNTTLDGLQIHNTEAVDTTNRCVMDDNPDTGMVIKNNILVTDNSTGILITDIGWQGKIFNNVIYATQIGGDSLDGIRIVTGDIVEIYNNTIDGFLDGDGIEIDAVTTSVTVKNNAVFNNGTDFDDAVGVTTNKNASDDAFGTNPVTLDSTNNYQDEFTDMANNDYSVKDSGSELYDAGEADVFADDNDIIGTSRPQGSAWDIGAFELIVAAAAGQAFRLRAIEKYFMPIFDDITDKTVYKRNDKG